MSNLFDVLIEFPPSFNSFPVTNDLYGFFKLLGGSASIKDLEKSLIFRVDSIEIPSFTPNTTEISYKGQSITRLTHGHSGTNKISITFRVDAPYLAYLAFKKWMSHYSLPDVNYTSSKGFINPEETDYAPSFNTGKIHIVTLTNDVFLTERDTNPLLGSDSSINSSTYGFPGITEGAFTPPNTSSRRNDGGVSSALLKHTLNDKPIMYWSYAGVYPINVSNPSYNHSNADPLKCTIDFLFTKWRSPIITRLSSQMPIADLSTNIDIGFGSIWD